MKFIYKLTANISSLFYFLFGLTVQPKPQQMLLETGKVDQKPDR